jgi:hypothetical protein
MCSKSDPDSWVVFQAALSVPASPQTAPAQTADASMAGVAVAAAPHALRASADSFGLSPSGKQQGWVALMRHEPGQEPESHFEGYAVTDATLPAVGAKLTARRMIPVWLEPLLPGPNPPAKLQGRLASGMCVRVLATRPGPGRNWAEVVPTGCS